MPTQHSASPVSAGIGTYNLRPTSRPCGRGGGSLAVVSTARLPAGPRPAGRSDEDQVPTARVVMTQQLGANSTATAVPAVRSSRSMPATARFSNTSASWLQRISRDWLYAFDAWPWMDVML